MRVFYKFLFIYVLVSCGSQKALTSDREVFYLRRTIHVQDSCNSFCDRWVFSSIPADSLIFYDRHGKPLIVTDHGQPDTPFVRIANYNKSSVFLNDLSFRNLRITWMIMPDYSISFSGVPCNKILQIDTHRFKGKSTVLWQSVEDSTGIWTFYQAPEKSRFPYIDTPVLKLAEYDLNHFCSEKDIQEEIRDWQKLFDAKCKVMVSPNPFKEEVHFRFEPNLPYFLLGANTYLLSFFDRTNRELYVTTIEPDRDYTFTLPNAEHGQSVFYKITWSDYHISGQIFRQ